MVGAEMTAQTLLNWSQIGVSIIIRFISVSLYALALLILLFSIFHSFSTWLNRIHKHKIQWLQYVVRYSLVSCRSPRGAREANLQLHRPDVIITIIDIIIIFHMHWDCTEIGMKRGNIKFRLKASHSIYRMINLALICCNGSRNHVEIGGNKTKVNRAPVF